MTAAQQSARPLLRSLRQSGLAQRTVGSPAIPPASLRCFNTTRANAQDTSTTTTTTGGGSNGGDGIGGTPANLKYDPNTVTSPWGEQRLMKKGIFPIGSRRRRAALRTTPETPFELLPFQCFQEARKVLQEDRREKLQRLVQELDEIKSLEALDPSKVKGGEPRKQRKLESMRQFAEQLKIMADINDPMVKRRFEDGMGDMTKPIYRYLASRKWYSGVPRRVTVQRVSQFNIVPDILPKFEPTMPVELYFRAYKVPAGDIVSSAVSEVCPRLRVQYFDKQPVLASVVVMDSDVPDPEKDTFSRRCHYMAANIPIGPTTTSIPLSKPNMTGDLAVPWLPAFAQKGSPYHRLTVWVMIQNDSQKPLDTAKLTELYSGRDGFSLKSFRDKFGLTPAGFSMFRSVWDPTTAQVMERNNIPGADVEFKHQRAYSLRPPRRKRGWEAKRSKPKYKSLWKYTRRIGRGEGKK